MSLLLSYTKTLIKFLRPVYHKKVCTPDFWSRHFQGGIASTHANRRCCSRQQWKCQLVVNKQWNVIRKFCIFYMGENQRTSFWAVASRWGVWFHGGLEEERYMVIDGIKTKWQKNIVIKLLFLYHYIWKRNFSLQQRRQHTSKRAKEPSLKHQNQ